jgi:hypothetical protein
MAVLPETAIEIGELEGLLSGNVRSRNTVMLFDVGRQLSPDWRLAGSNLVNEYLVRLASREQGRAVLVSSNVDQVSHDRSSGAAAQGVFTAWILDGLQGRADWNQDRIVTVAELFRYVSDKVRQETAGTQRPQYQSADDQVPVAALR